MTLAPLMRETLAAPMRMRVVGPGRPCEAWLRHDAVDDVGGRQSACPLSDVIPLKSGTHASLHTRSIGVWLGTEAWDGARSRSRKGDAHG